MDSELPPISELEKENLEVHVNMSTMRFLNLEKRLDKIEEKVDEIHEDITNGNRSLVKVFVGSTGTIIAGLLSTIVVILIQNGQ